MNELSLTRSETIKNSQSCSLIIVLLFSISFSGCGRSSEEIPVTPPITHPLTREYIGYGVVNVSFAHLLDEPGTNGVSRGYLRRGTVVRILERRPVINRTNSESWIFVEGNYSSAVLSPGWLLEATVEVYDNESRAITASKVMSQ